MKLLLINPRYPESFWSFRWAMENFSPGRRTLNPPLGLAVVAALCPEHWEIQIVDENVESLPLEPEADIVGVGGMSIQYPRQRELLNYYRNQGYPVVAGGSHASLCPEAYADLADTVISGEAEYIWPAFCRDFEAGATQRLYRETGIVRLEHSPIPRFDLLQLDHYTNPSLEFSRGCPFRCEFCDVIVMFGRKPRTKPPEQIGRELDQLRALGVHTISFSDDNLIGHRPKAKELLRYLADYQEETGHEFQFGCQASLNLAEDERLLSLLRDANFRFVFLGIESPDEASLLETQKVQNLRGDMLSSISTIYGHGLDVLGGFIVGFDNDTLATFDHQERFITSSGIQVAMVGLLKAAARTPLYERLARENRLREGGEPGDNTAATSNIIPKRMAYADMVEAYKSLYRRLFSDRGIARRIQNKCRLLRDPSFPKNGGGSPQRTGALVLRVLTRAILPGGPVRWFLFTRSLCTAPVRMWHIVIGDWIRGLSIRDYVDRHFEASSVNDQRLVTSAMTSISRACRESLASGALEIRASEHTSRPQLEITLRGWVERPFFRQTRRSVKRLLRRRTVQVSLDLQASAPSQLGELTALVKNLERFGDRVSIRMDQSLRPFVSVDSSVFRVVLE